MPSGVYILAALKDQTISLSTDTYALGLTPSLVCVADHITVTSPSFCVALTANPAPGTLVSAVNRKCHHAVTGGATI